MVGTSDTAGVQGQRVTGPGALAGRTALVTGASRGIGRAIARRLAAHGARLLLTASARSEQGLHQSCALIAEAGGTAESLVADLLDVDARAALMDSVQARGGIDILVNNAAAITAWSPPSRIEADALRAMFEINLHAPIDLMQRALPVMRERGWGRVLNIGSETVAQPPIPYPGPEKQVHALVAYGASKAALDRWTTGLAAELHGSGITVNSLRPWRIARSESAEAVAAQLEATHPDWIEPVEMMAEAAWRLIAGGQTGRVVASRTLLQELQAPLHALDGITVIGDARSVGQAGVTA